MNFEHLASFVTIVEVGSFRKAAERLNKAQPAISYAIKSLEQDLNLTLFDRTTYKPTLTIAGKTFYQKAVSILDQTKDLKSYAEFLSSGGDSQVKLSITALFPLTQISSALKNFTKDNPYTDLKINVDVLSTMIRLENNEADIGISELIQWPYDKYESIELCKIKMIPVIAAKHPILESEPKNGFESQDIKNIPQVVIQSTLSEAKDIKAGVISENLRWSVSDFKTKETMLLESLGWGFMPDHMVNILLKSKQLTVLNLAGQSIFDYPLYALRTKSPKNWGPSLESLWSALTKTKK